MATLLSFSLIDSNHADQQLAVERIMSIHRIRIKYVVVKQGNLLLI